MPSRVNTLSDPLFSPKYVCGSRVDLVRNLIRAFPPPSFSMLSTDCEPGRPFPSQSAPSLSSSFLIMPCRQRRRDCYLARLSIALLSAAEPRGSVDQSEDLYVYLTELHATAMERVSYLPSSHFLFLFYIRITGHTISPELIRITQVLTYFSAYSNFKICNN